VYVAGRGLCINGDLDDDAKDRLEVQGITVQPHTWEPVITDATWFDKASEQERQERLAADIMLGRMPDSEGRTRLERDIAAAYAKATEPMNPRSLLAKMRKTFRRNW